MERARMMDGIPLLKEVVDDLQKARRRLFLPVIIRSWIYPDAAIDKSSSARLANQQELEVFQKMKAFPSTECP